MKAFGYFSRFSVLLILIPIISGQNAGRMAAPSHLTDVFSTGWMLKDTNADGIADFVEGNIVVPDQPTAAENAAAANFAARLMFGSTGLTPPLVVTVAEVKPEGPHIYIGRNALPRTAAADIAPFERRLGMNEGGVFTVGNDIAVIGHDDDGLTAAANGFAARSPFIWKVPGDRLQSVTDELNRGSSNAHARIAGLTFMKGRPLVNRVFLRADSRLTALTLKAALNSPHLAYVHELVVIGSTADVTAISLKPLPPAPPTPAADSAASTPASAPGNSTETAGATPTPLDLAALYTSRGLFKGTPKMPIPSSSDGQLYVPAGKLGVAMANLAARMGLETTGLSLPLAFPVSTTAAKDIRVKAVLPEDSALGKQAVGELQKEENGSAGRSLSADEGEARIVDHAFAKQPAVLLRGDQNGALAALNLLTDRFPNIWGIGKQFGSLEELRFDLHRFFSLRSGVGQSAVALYHLNRWSEEISKQAGPVHDVKAEVFVDLADAKLADFVRKQLSDRLHVAQVDVKAASLHAGTQCCAQNPELHYDAPGYEFKQGTPAFEENISIPWEGTRLLNLVRDSLKNVKSGQPVKIVARVSEGPETRSKLKAQLLDAIAKQGLDPKASQVTVLCAYKQGYSWLMDEVAPSLKGKPVAAIKIEFSKDVDPTGVRVMYSPARWVQELYPVDEMLAKELNVPLAKITFDQVEPTAAKPTYRVFAYDASGAELDKADFTVATTMRPYNGVMPRYEQVQISTGWVKMDAAGQTVLDQRIKTDIEEFWDHYQDETLPKVYRIVMAQAKGDLKPEYAPPFDTIRLDVHMSEPDYSIGLDKERISSLEALQEDTFYSTENFINMSGDLEAGRPMTYVGRVIPVVHASEDGRDGSVNVQFYAKPAANPSVRLSWTDAQGKQHQEERNLPALSGSMQPRLIGARAKAGEQTIEELTWLLPADYMKDDFAEWVKLEPQDGIEHSVFSVEQAKGQIHWLEAMHHAGLYRDELTYGHVKRMAAVFELPVPLAAKADSAPPRTLIEWNVPAPATPRPQIAQAAHALDRTPLVQWDEPISPDENAAILAKLGKSPGVNVYWMGRSYLGRDMWAADFMLPSPAQMRSWAKETTLKASILYSGRQHANEVSSTSHLDKLGEQLVTDPATRAMLKQVNVVLHPIDNPDGAQLSVTLAKVTPDNLLHPGYHGSLAADVSVGQAEPDPVYPESRVRRLLLESWLPDGFLNPHGYPSHEWVQPFSEYTGWVQSREGANPGRAWWIPRGWFTSLTYIRDPEHPYSEKVTYELRDKIVEAERNVPGLLPLETRMNDRYQRFGQRWQPKDMTQPIVNGIRIYMALKGSPASRGTGEAQRSGSATGGVSPDITWDSGYTEAPDETAHGDYMKLMASAGLAFDRVHLAYMANGKLRIRHVQRDAGDKVTWQVLRDRPNLPASELSSPSKEAGDHPTSDQQ